jgi:tRNA-uridine 2-sulfurtransferase
MRPTVAVAMSGGVDSSVAAALLKEEGCDVIGITLQLWPKGVADRDRHHGCCSLDAVEDARRVAARLDIPYYVLDVQEEFNRRVIEPFLGDYEQGLTPNPCISCNSEVKFDLLLRKARDIGADRLATGHYARIDRGDDGRSRLLRAVDHGKDQSYVLYGLSQEELSRAWFPLGEWHKPAVRDKARELGLVTADKPDSVEICFVTSGDYRDLLARRSAPGEGEIRHLDGTVLGRHGGVWNYTVGQRSGLGSLPRGIAGPLFVLDIDAAAGVVVVGPREALAGRRLAVGELSFISGVAPADEFEAEVRIRYGAEPAPAWVRLDGPGRALVEPHDPVSAAAPGQAAVLHRGDEVLGGGRILRQVA